MAKTVRTLGAAVMAMVLAATRPVAAESPRTVVVQVEDLYGAPTQALQEAQQQASGIYAAIGVSLVWVNKGADASHIPEGAMWLDVALLSQSRTEALLGLTLVPKSALGISPNDKVRVYIFCGRIARRASTSESFETILGRVLAHEIGHQLLPSRGHSDRGIMRSSANFRSREPPTFTKAQADAIRAHLVKSRSAR